MALPEQLPMPTQGAYPNPTGGGFPMPTALSDPMFGVNPWARAGERLYVPKLFNPAAGIPDLAARATMRDQFASQLQLAGLRSLGVPLEEDPREWDPATAAEQTDQAIAKIAQVNPELAQQLIEKRTGQPEEDGGFFDDLKDLAGDIFAPVLSIGGQLLEVIGRTSHIIPSLVMDLSDGGSFDPLDDIGGALTGRDKTAWSDVLDKWGVDNGFIKGVLGFVGDVATDPLTWVTLGAAPLASAGAKAAKLVGTKSDDVFLAARKVFAGADDETIAKHLVARYDQMTQGLAQQGVKLGDDVAERAFGLVRHQWDAAEQGLMRDMFELADKSYRWFRSGTMGTALRKDATIALSSGRTVSAREVKSMLDEVISSGAWKGRGDDAWAAARDASSAMRGLRVRAAIPFTKLRYISPSLPGTRGLGFLGLNRARQLFAGQLGMSRLVSLTASGVVPQELGDRALTAWMEGGFTKLAQDPELSKVADLLKGRGRNLGPALYTASEGVGRITAHLSTGARASRAGLVGYLADNQAKQVRSIVNHFLRETGYAVEDQKGQTGRDALLREMENTLGLSLRRAKNTATPEAQYDMARYLDFFPPGVDVTNDQAIADWFWNLSEPRTAKAIADLSPFGVDLEATDALLKQQRRLKEMQEVASRVRTNPHARATLDKVSAVWDHARREAGKYDAFLHDVRAGFDEVGILAREQVGEWQGHVDGFLKGEWEANLGTAGNLRLGSHGITDDAVTHGDRLRGVHLRRTAGEATSQHRAVVRAKDIIVVDTAVADDATAGAGSLLRAAEEEADAILRQTQDAINEAAGLPGFRSAASVQDQAQRRVEMVTKYIRRHRPEADGVTFRHADGSEDLIIFDPKNVKTVSDGAPHIVAERGFFHRRFTPELLEYIRGAREREATKFLNVEPRVEAFIGRKTRGMTLSEAEAFVRKEYFPELPEHIRVWDTDVLSVHERYLSSLGEAIQSELLGKTARRFVELGDVAPALFGGTPRAQVYDWVLNPAYLRALKRLDTKTANAIVKANERGVRYMEEQHAQHAKTAEEVGTLTALIDDALANGTEVPDRVVAALRRWGATVSEAEARIGRELAAVEKQKEHWAQQTQLLEDARRSLRGNETLYHPGPGEDVAIFDLPDGRVEVRGYHGSFVEGGVPALYGAKELRYGGFHIGTYYAGLNRTGQLAADELREDALDLERYVHPVVVRGRIFGLEKPGQGALPGADQLWGQEDIDSIFPFGASGLGQKGPAAYSPAELKAAGYDGIAYVNRVEGASDAGGSSISVAMFEMDHVYASDAHDMVDRLAEQGELYLAPNGDPVTRAGYLRTGGRKVAAPSDIRTAQRALAARVAELQDLQAALREGAGRPAHTRVPAKQLVKLVEFPGRTAVAADGTMRGRTAQQVEELRTRLRDLGYDPDFVPEGVTERIGPIVVDYDQAAGRAVIREGHHRLGLGAELGIDIPIEVRATGTAATRGADIDEVVASPGLSALSELAGAGPEVGVKVSGELKALLDRELARPALPAVERRVSEAAEAVGREVGARAERVAATAKSQERKLQRLRTMTNLAIGEANKAYAEAHGMVTKVRPALVKVETSGELGGMVRLRVPGLEGYAMPAYIAEEFHHLVDVHGVGEIRQAWRRWVLGPWKRWATYRWPGFHVRNTFGAWFNNLLGGVNDKDYVFSWRVNRAREGMEKWADRAVTPEELKLYHLDRVFGEGREVTYSDIAALMGDMGIGRANTMAVYGAGNAAGEVHEMYRAKSSNAARRLAQRVDDRMRNIGTGVEDFHRVAAWARGMAATTGDTYGARTFVMMRHGDYSDLTEVEEVIRDIVPFYKWMRTNVPYQFRMLAEHPGLLTVPDKLKTAVYEAQGLDREKAEMQQPAWMKESLALPVPSWVPLFGSKDKNNLKFLLFDLPYSDLHNGLTDYLSSALPVVRNVIESYGVGSTVFSGRPLTGEFAELSGVFNIPGVRDVLVAANLARRGQDGKVYIEDKMQNVLMGWPIYSRFRNFVEGEPERVEARLGGLFSMLAGFNLRDGDYVEAELDFFYNEVRPLLDMYRSLGVEFPSFQDVQSGSVGSALGLSDPEDIDVAGVYAQGVLSGSQGTGAVARSVSLPSQQSAEEGAA